LIGATTSFLASTVLAMITSLPLSHIPVAETCKGLCIHAVEASGSHIVAYLYYNGSALQNRTIEVVLNHRYIANIATNDTGALSMYAPFSLGRNMISMEYKGSIVNYLFYYFASYLSLALLPIGAAFYISIRILSEHGTANKEVTINFDSEQEERRITPDKKLVLDTAAQLYGRNARTYMVKALPVSIDEISAALHEFLGHKNATGIEESVNAACANTYYGVLCKGAMPYTEIAAKRLYETAMNTGAGVLKDDMSMSSFLRANGIVHFIEMYSDAKFRLRTSGRVSIAVSARNEKKAIRALLARYSCACAFLLFNELNESVRVIGC